MLGRLSEYTAAIQLLAETDAELKLVIAGNHDMTLDEEYWAFNGQKMHRLPEPDLDMARRAKEMWVGEEARRLGIRYLEEGVHEFRLKSGARLRVCEYQFQFLCFSNSPLVLCLLYHVFIFSFSLDRGLDC